MMLESEHGANVAELSADEAALASDDLGFRMGDAGGGQSGEVVDGNRLWPGDSGSLTLQARSALLQLVRGPYLIESRDGDAWRALMAHRSAVESRLSDLFLELVVDEESGVAFARNVKAEEAAFPKAARSYHMTLLDSIMVLTLRRELLTSSGGGRVFIGQDELFESLEQYRNLGRTDPSSFNARLKSAWGRLVEARILLKSDVEGRFEISPILRVVFGPDEAKAVGEALEQMLERERADGGSESGAEARDGE